MALLALLDLALTLLAFYLAWALKPQTLFGLIDLLGPGPFSLYSWILALVIPVWPILLLAFGLYENVLEQAPETLFSRLVKALSLGLVIFGAAVFFAQAKDFSRFIAVSFFVLDFLFLLAARLLIRALEARARRTPTLLVVASGNGGSTTVRELLLRRRAAGLPVEWIDVELDDADGLFECVWQRASASPAAEVFIAAPLEFEPFLESSLRGISARLLLEFDEPWLLKAHAESFHDVPTLTLGERAARSTAALACKRAIDVAAAGTLLLLYSPLLLAIAILIKSTSRGPVLFRQDRCGEWGRRFTLYKFRSMAVGAEARQSELKHLNETLGPTFKMRRDPRVTSIGRLLRRFSLDELPQLWNVLLGDMSLIGPRPLFVEEAEKARDSLGRRFEVRPGLTCLWQVLGRSEIPFGDWTKLDRCYVDNWSFGLDLKILLRTIPAVVLARGAH